MEMIETPRPVVFDCVVVKEENCYPMIPSGAAHYEMLLGPEDRVGKPISEEGMVLVSGILSPHRLFRHTALTEAGHPFPVEAMANPNSTDIASRPREIGRESG